jgi:hypothetical protein
MGTLTLYLQTLDSADHESQDATLAHFSGYTEEQIQPVLELMVDYLHGPVAHEAFFKKYASKKFLKGKMVSCSKNEN